MALPPWLKGLSHSPKDDAAFKSLAATRFGDAPALALSRAAHAA